MSATIQCLCGRQIAIPSESSAQRIRCPACQALLQIPGAMAGAAESEGYQTERLRTCPRCRREWPENTVVCIECG